MKRLLFLLLFPAMLHAQNCNGVIFNKDKFTGAIEVKTPRKHAVCFTKQIVDGDTAYYAHVSRITTDLLNSENLGVYILFSNEQKVQRPTINITETIISSGVLYTTTFQLDSYDLGVFKDQKITDVRLGGIDFSLMLKQSKEIFDAFNCLILK